LAQACQHSEAVWAQLVGAEEHGGIGGDAIMTANRLQNQHG